MDQDMTLLEFCEAKQALEKEIGPDASIYAEIGARFYRRCVLTATVYPKGVGRDSLGTVAADTLRDLLAATRQQWEERRDEVAAKTINGMALTIIRLTHEQGSCTDAALRQEFSAETVKRYGEAAVKRADDMAAGGPFRIVAIAGANAA